MAQSCPAGSVRPYGLWPARLLSPQDSPGKNTEWVAISFSRGSSWPRDQTPHLLHLLHWQAGSLPLAPPQGKQLSDENWDSILLGRSPGEGKGYPLQYSGLENSMDCIAHGVANSQARLSDLHFHFHLLISEERMMKLGHCHFATPNDLMDLGNDHQWFLMSGKQRQKDLCGIWWWYNNIAFTVLPKSWSWNWMCLQSRTKQQFKDNRVNQRTF